MKAFWDNFFKIAIGIILLYFVFFGNVQWKQFIDGGAKIAKEVKQ